MWLKMMLTNAEIGTSAVAAASGALLGGIIAGPFGFLPAQDSVRSLSH